MITGGIIAAGHGSRLKDQGFLVPKPLVKVHGRELLGRTVEHFGNAGINRIRVIFRKAICRECSKFLLRNFPQIHFDIICRDTDSSAESFLSLLREGYPDERQLISTVDSIFEEGAFASFVKRAGRAEKDAVVLGVTGFVDDEKPLYVSLEKGVEGQIKGIGGQSGDAVTCGVYLVPVQVRNIGKRESFPALRKFLGRLFFEGVPFWGVDMGTVIDVDRAEDVKKARAFLAGSRI